MITCEHVIVQRVVLLLNFNKLYPISITKIVEITYSIYHGLSKRRLCNKFVRRNVNAPEVNFRRHFTFARTPSFSSREITWLEPAIQSENQILVSGQLKKHPASMSSKLELAIWSLDTGQRIVCCDSCQLTITWMPKIKDVAMAMVLLS